jgi:hypothetical protein
MRAKFQNNNYSQESADQLDQGIGKSDWLSTITATAPKQDKTQDGDEINRF